ncbi:Uncharacterised protein [Fusobacterium necrogenes]|uniref:Uncharacterized protein n=1 Tax=Fusobacterium necrogenes TaxID=858 RepID=A0A377GY65_9FUSO|nr:hypothetical protein [Fusobacterium necrogenes]STO31702.1 Uncharacterised protein [Fusobacterium necrogenes]
MLTLKERLELDELEKINKKFNVKENRELEDKYEYDNRAGMILLLVSYCGIGIFILYKVAELLLKKLG